MALTDSLISYWKLDEASGNATDSHGSNTLTDVNTVGTATGKINGARDFEEASSESLNHASNSDLVTGDIDFTFTCWLQLESKPAHDMAAIGKGTNSEGEYFVQWQTAADRIKFRVFGASAFGSEGTATANTLGAPSLATWYFVVAWHDSVANTVNIQVNDGTVDSAAHSAGCYALSGGAFALAWPEFTNYWDGLIDEVGFWKRVLTSGERTQLYNGGAGLAYPFSGGGVTVKTLAALGVGS